VYLRHNNIYTFIGFIIGGILVVFYHYGAATMMRPDVFTLRSTLLMIAFFFGVIAIAICTVELLLEGLYSLFRIPVKKIVLTLSAILGMLESTIAGLMTGTIVISGVILFAGFI